MLVCAKCNHSTRVNAVIFKKRKEAGLPYLCTNDLCDADLVEAGIRPKVGKSDSQKRSQKQEKRAAKRTGGRVQPGSGSKPGAKGDVRNAGALRMECKTTTKKSFTLKLSELEKLEGEATSGENPVFEIEFSGVHPSRRFVVLPGWLYDHYATLAGDAG
jgi:hypothetical protein